MKRQVSEMTFRRLLDEAPVLTSRGFDFGTAKGQFTLV